MSIPSNATKVFTGVIFDVYQWEQQLFDGTTATFERLTRPDTVQIIPVIDTRIIIAHEEQPDRAPYYSLLGGRIESQESALAAAKRELKEESGIEAATWIEYGKTMPMGKIEWTIHTYIAKQCAYRQAPSLDAGEKITLMTLSVDDFIDYVTQPEFRGIHMSLDVLRMHKQGTLDAWKKWLIAP
jgi:ADP-ribose pyrophosphatase